MQLKWVQLKKEKEPKQKTKKQRAQSLKSAYFAWRQIRLHFVAMAYFLSRIHNFTHKHNGCRVLTQNARHFHLHTLRGSAYSSSTLASLSARIFFLSIITNTLLDPVHIFSCLGSAAEKHCDANRFKGF